MPEVQSDQAGVLPVVESLRNSPRDGFQVFAQEKPDMRVERARPAVAVA